MTIESVTIPLAVLNNTQYQSLPPRTRDFMISLYVLFEDCLTFTINFDKPEDYRKAKTSCITAMVADLVDIGLIDIVARRPRPQRGPSERVYAFRYVIPGMA